MKGTLKAVLIVVAGIAVYELIVKRYVTGIGQG